MKVDLQLPSGKDYLSPSSAGKLCQHPISYLSYIKDDFEPNQEMIFGQYYEDLLFDRDMSKYFIYDDNKVIEKAIEKRGEKATNIRATKEYKEVKVEVLEEAKGKIVLTEDEHDNAIRMSNIIEDTKVKEVHLSGEAQVKHSNSVDTDMFTAKALVISDIVQEKGRVVNDLKTTSAELEAWKRKATSMNYDIQAYLSFEVWDAEEFRFIVQRTKGLHEVGVFEVHRDSWFYDSGKRKFNQAIQNYLDFFSPEAKSMQVEPSNYVIYRDL